jgi:hypothetical protein
MPLRKRRRAQKAIADRLDLVEAALIDAVLAPVR